MLGADIIRAGERAGHEMVLLTHAQLDISNADAVDEAVRVSCANAVVNCAAWTDVDGAEANPEGARAANAIGAGNLARAASAAGTQLVHVSTDYVFIGDAPLDGNGKQRPYVESDPTGPRSVYGRTKLEGERLVLDASPLHTVARSSWLFGVDGRNFVDTMLKLAVERDAVQVVDDQVGCPTWTGHSRPWPARVDRARGARARSPRGQWLRVVERFRQGDIPPSGGQLWRGALHHRRDGASRPASGVVCD